MSTIRFSSPELQDSGYYVCIASNPVDQESWEVVFDVYPLGSHFVDKGFADVAFSAELGAGEDEDDMCGDGACEDVFLLGLEDGGDQTAAIASPSGGILLAVVGGAGVLIAAVVVVILVLLSWRCARK